MNAIASTRSESIQNRPTLDVATHSQKTSPYTVERGDTLSAIAHRYGTDAGAIAQTNDLRNPDLIYSGQKLALPAGAAQNYPVRAGDTMSSIAARAGVPLRELAAANPQIRNINRIYPGDQIAVPNGAAVNAERPVARAGHIGIGAERPVARPAENQITVGMERPVARPHTGDALTAIGAERPLSRPGIDADRPVPRPVTSVGETRMAGGTLHLTQTDVDNIAKTLQTEWVQSAGDDQARGIIDTILNRVASGRWGNTVADVVNARSQFSNINGEDAWERGRNSVEQLPMSGVSQNVRDFTSSYLAERAAGTPSSIGTHLNYANPHFSDASNLVWINALDAATFGRGVDIHRHGTTPDNERYRPNEFAIALPAPSDFALSEPGQMAISEARGMLDPRQSRSSEYALSSQVEAGTSAALSNPAEYLRRTVDGRLIASEVGVEVKVGVELDGLHSSMDAAIRAVAQGTSDLGLSQRVITSGTEGTHSDGSLHYSGRALDIRGNDLSVEEGYALEESVREILGAQYDVVFETFSNERNNHLHVEFDPN